MNAERLAGLRTVEHEAKRALDEKRAAVHRLHAALREAQEEEDRAHRTYLKARDAVETEEES